MMQNGSKDAPSERGNKEKYARIILLCRKCDAVHNKEGKKENLMREDCRVGIS